MPCKAQHRRLLLLGIACLLCILLDAASLHSKLSFARQPGLRAALIAAMSGKGSLLLLSFLVFFYNMHVLGHNLGYMSLECGNWP